MKIARNPNNELEIKSNTLIQILIGAIFTVVGIFMGYMFLSGSADSAGNAPSIWLLVAGIVFVLVGLFITWQAKSTRIILRPGGSSTVEKHRFIGGKTISETFVTTDVTAVVLSAGTQTFNSGSGEDRSANMQRTATLSLLLKSGALIELGSKANQATGMSSGNFTKINAQKPPLTGEAEQIASFLNVPVQTTDTLQPTQNPIAVAEQIARTPIQTGGISEISPMPAPTVTTTQSNQAPTPAPTTPPRPATPAEPTSPPRPPQQ